MCTTHTKFSRILHLTRLNHRILKLRSTTGTSILLLDLRKTLSRFLAVLLTRLRRPLDKAEKATTFGSKLDALIAEFVSKDVMDYSSHEDLLASIRVQRPHLRYLYKLPTE